MKTSAKYLDSPVTEKISENKENKDLTFGVSSMQGWRSTQEDAHNCLLNFHSNTSLFAVYDGHRGASVAIYSARHLPDIIRQNENFARGDYFQALKDGFLEYDATLITRKVMTELKQIEHEHTQIKNRVAVESGCTAVLALIHNDTLYVANAGDSRCIVSRNREPIEMSFDHKPWNPLEKMRIVNAGGKVTEKGRINGGLNLSRALGDHAYKQQKSLGPTEQMITALPDVKTLEIDRTKDEFMVLACDGIWESMTNQEVVDFVCERLDRGVEKLSDISEELFDTCLGHKNVRSAYGRDNMTCLIVRWKIPGGLDSLNSKWITSLLNGVNPQKLQESPSLLSPKRVSWKVPVENDLSKCEPVTSRRRHTVHGMRERAPSSPSLKRPSRVKINGLNCKSVTNTTGSITLQERQKKAPSTPCQKLVDRKEPVETNVSNCESVSSRPSAHTVQKQQEQALSTPCLIRFSRVEDSGLDCKPVISRSRRHIVQECAPSMLCQKRVNGEEPAETNVSNCKPVISRPRRDTVQERQEQAPSLPKRLNGKKPTETNVSNCKPVISRPRRHTVQEQAPFTPCQKRRNGKDLAETVSDSKPVAGKTDLRNPRKRRNQAVSAQELTRAKCAKPNENTLNSKSVANKIGGAVLCDRKRRNCRLPAHYEDYVFL